MMMLIVGVLTPPGDDYNSFLPNQDTSALYDFMKLQAKFELITVITRPHAC